ncbi:uncharacterized protein LOC135104546 [Scylla paramamosain]|uniref:uncharacterized protein LOC135104546 n=1 Tax=Scylla paramamosain TaxID=85552 RepID=UPI003083D235
MNSTQSSRELTLNPFFFKDTQLFTELTEHSRNQTPPFLKESSLRSENSQTVLNEHTRSGAADNLQNGSLGEEASLTHPMNTSSCLRVVVVEYNPFISINGNTHPKTVGGCMTKVMDIISRKLNFCYEFVVAKEKPPSASPIGLMLRNQADLTGFPVPFANFQMFDQSEPLYLNSQRLCYKRPELEQNIAGFLMPFNASVSDQRKLCNLYFMVGYFASRPVNCTTQDPMQLQFGERWDKHIPMP